MAVVDFSRWTLYRWRYWIGYGVVGITLAVLLLFAGLFLPGGLSTDEQASTIASDSLNLGDVSSLARGDLPYHILQATSLNWFGVSDFSIKLPSLFLALLAALGIIFLLWRWFSHNIAVVGAFIAVATGQFLFLAQSGTPSILYIFWPVVLLLLASLITHNTRGKIIWVILFCVSLALSLYTPLSIYPIIAMIIAAGAHPHLRHSIRRISKGQFIASLIAGIILLAPLVYGITMAPKLGLHLLGIPDALPNLWDNIKTIFYQYVDFWDPSTTKLMTPVFGLGSTLLILFGLYRIIRNHSSTQSYLLIAWLVCLIPVLLINPAFTAATFVPLIMLMVSGLEGLIGYWYRLFPRNPYARIAGLLPLIVLVLALVLSGLERYGYGYYYHPATASNFNHDLQIMPNKLENLVVSKDELAFYQVLAKHRPGLNISLLPLGQSFVATRQAHNNLGGTPAGYKIYQIVTDPSSNQADRFYIYQKVVQ